MTACSRRIARHFAVLKDCDRDCDDGCKRLRHAYVMEFALPALMLCIFRLFFNDLLLRKHDFF